MGTYGSLAQRIGVLVVLGLLLAYLGLFLMGMQETRDAKAVEQVQVSLQSALSRGMAMLNLPASQIYPDNIINAAKVSFPKGAQVDRNFRLSLTHSPRQAMFKIQQDGTLKIESLTNFTRYHVENGRIVRNNHWLVPLPWTHQPTATPPVAATPGIDG